MFAYKDDRKLQKTIRRNFVLNFVTIIKCTDNQLIMSGMDLGLIRVGGFEVLHEDCCGLT